MSERCTSTVQGCFYIELGPYKKYIEVFIFQGYFSTYLSPYKSASSFKSFQCKNNYVALGNYILLISEHSWA